ncbi:MAG: hypothetical protein EDM82_01880 [Cyanobacteria bacterium CYA]|nr:MAG: hypothetical protein EDM82_01880 [Cyanobacteria bacterium CYA]
MNLPTRLSISCFCGLAALFCSIAQAQTCPFTFSHNADSLTHTCTEITTGVFDLKITVTDDGSPTVAVIVNDLPGGGPPAIRVLRIWRAYLPFRWRHPLVESCTWKR